MKNIDDLLKTEKDQWVSEFNSSDEICSKNTPVLRGFSAVS